MCKAWFESGWCFCNITKIGWFSKQLLKNKVPNNLFEKSVQKRPYADLFKIGLSLKFRSESTPVLESLFDNFVKKDSNTGVFL